MHIDQLKKNKKTHPLFAHLSFFYFIQAPKSWACGCVSHLWRPTAWTTFCSLQPRTKFPYQTRPLSPPFHMGHKLQSPRSLGCTGASLELSNVEGKWSTSQGGWAVGWGGVRKHCVEVTSGDMVCTVTMSMSCWWRSLVSTFSLSTHYQHLFHHQHHCLPSVHLHFLFILLLLLFLGPNCVWPVPQEKKKNKKAKKAIRQTLRGAKFAGLHTLL